MKKALAIFGSPRKGGNTDSAMDALLAALAGEGKGDGEETQVEIEKVKLRKLDIAPCIACYKCARKKPCVIDDDMIGLYKKLDEADIVILGSPLAFSSVNAQTKAMIDRLQAFYVSKHLRKSPLLDTKKPRSGCFVCTAGQKDADTAGVLLVADLFFKAVNATHVANLIFDNTDRAPVRNREELAERSKRTAHALLGFFTPQIAEEE